MYAKSWCGISFYYYSAFFKTGYSLTTIAYTNPKSNDKKVKKKTVFLATMQYMFPADYRKAVSVSGHRLNKNDHFANPGATIHWSFDSC